MSDSNIMLDPKIRDWVLIPIFIVMFLQGILRQFIGVLLRDEKKTTKSMLEEMETNQNIRRARQLRANAAYIPSAAFRMRKAFFVEAFKEKPRDRNAQQDDLPNPMGGDPMQMVGMMKQNMMSIIPNMLMMGWTSYFFSGFVLVKLPFGLWDRFKSMLQRGIGLQSLDVSYVSSLSWYILLLFGMRGVFDVVLGDNNDAVDNTKMMQAQMTGGMAGMGGPQQADMKKIMETEKTELEIFQHDFVVPSAETRLAATAQANK